MALEQATPSPAKEQFILRFPEGMREQLKKVAAANRRSMNAELLLLIERGLGNAGAQTLNHNEGV